MDYKFIESSQNPGIKEIKKLKDKKFRKSLGCFLIEGERFVKEAIREKANIRTIIVSQDFKDRAEDILKNFNGEVIVTKESVLKEITDTVTPQGICAVAEIPKSPEFPEHGRYLYLDRIQDPGNLGTIIRSAHAFDFSGLIIGRGTCDVYSDKVLRSTMGSVFKVPLIYSDTDGLKKMKDSGFTLYMADLKAEKSLDETEFTEPYIIVIGNEANGISSEILSIEHHGFRLDMPGNAESLNAAVASSIIMYMNRK